MTFMRDKNFQFRLNEAELQLIQEASSLSGLLPSVWARQITLAAAAALVANKEKQEFNMSFNSTGQVTTMSASVD